LSAKIEKLRKENEQQMYVVPPIRPLRSRKRMVVVEAAVKESGNDFSAGSRVKLRDGTVFFAGAQ